MSTPNGTMTTPKEIFPLDKTDPTTKTMKENEFPVEHTLEIMRHVSVVTKDRQTFGWRYWKAPEGTSYVGASAEAKAVREAYGTDANADTCYFEGTWAVWTGKGPSEGDPFEEERAEPGPERKTVSEWAQQPTAGQRCAILENKIADGSLPEAPPIKAPGFTKPEYTYELTHETLSYLARELYRVSELVPNDVNAQLFRAASDELHGEAIRVQRIEVDHQLLRKK